MNLLSYQDVENYLQNKQVYFKKEIANSDFKTIAESGKVHNIGKVELNRINESQIALTLNINGVDTTMYEYKSDLELFAWVRTNFIPVCELLERWSSMDKEQKVQNLHVSQHSSNEMLSDVLSMEYPLIPMSEIDEEAREIAIRWAGESGMDWIGDKHKLASDIMNYARRYLKKENRLQLPIEIDGKRGMITSLYTINTGITIVNVDFDKPNPHWKAYTLECILKSEYNRGIYDQSKAQSEYD